MLPEAYPGVLPRQAVNRDTDAQKQAYIAAANKLRFLVAGGALDEVRRAGLPHRGHGHGGDPPPGVVKQPKLIIAAQRPSFASILVCRNKRRGHGRRIPAGGDQMVAHQMLVRVQRSKQGSPHGHNVGGGERCRLTVIKQHLFA